MKRELTFREWLGATFIIILVAVVLLPSFFRARNPSHISCLSMEKQLGLAFIQYAYDHDGFTPPITHDSRNTWRVAVYPYIKDNEIYRCPKDDRTSGQDGHFSSYAMNAGAIFSKLGVPEKSINSAPHPEALVLLCEVQNTTDAYFDIELAAPSAHILAVRHAGGSNYLLSDGHAKWLRPSAFTYVPSSPTKLGLAVVRWHRDPRRPLSANEIATLADAQARAQ